MGTRPEPRGPLVSRRRALGAAAMACGAACMGCGIGSILHEASTAGSYEELASTSGVPVIHDVALTDEEEADQAGDAACRHDWDTLRQANQACCAWVHVAGTHIDLPVVRTESESEQSWYLTHDLWGSSSQSGTPFMDWRCPDADAPHVAVYAHHMTSSRAMFSDLQNAYKQGTFDKLGSLTWETHGGTVQGEPLCALRVDSSWQDIQRFEWGTMREFSNWLAGIVAKAGAVGRNPESLLAQAQRCITLVTCSSDFSFQPWRTLAIWAVV
jgi:SrtB family sortase